MFEKRANLSRRQLLKIVGTAGLGSVLLPGSTMGMASGATLQDKSEDRLVPTRPFGETGMQVSILSLGGMFDIPSNQLLLKQALKWGVTYWDTADCYGGGRSERGIGKFFSRYPDARKKVFLATKSDARDPAGMTQLLNRSLERMETNYIDLYLIHGLSHINELNAKTRHWVERTKAQKKIKFFGFSTHSNVDECLVAAGKLGWIDGIMMSYNFRLMHTKSMKAAVEACVRAGIGLTAMKTQGGGPVHMESKTELELAGHLIERGFTDKQAKLIAVWEDSHIASICSQMPNLTILMSNVDAATKGSKLSARDKRILEKYAHDTTSSYCAGCAHICEPAIEEKVPIRDVMRYLMYYHSYGDQNQAKGLFAKLPKEVRNKLLTLDFSPAERQCPHNLQIARLMREAAQVLA